MDKKTAKKIEKDLTRINDDLTFLIRKSKGNAMLEREIRKLNLETLLKIREYELFQLFDEY